MGCGNCECCKECTRVVITKQGERGPAGPPGVQGPRGIQGHQGNTGPAGQNGAAGSTWVQVFYSEQSLGPSSVGTSPTRTTIAGTSYTVPVSGQGEYRITYTVDMNLGDGASDVSYAVFVNGSPYGTIERRAVTSDIEIQNSSLVLSDVSLNDADVVDIRGESNDPTAHYPINGVCIIEKIS